MQQPTNSTQPLYENFFSQSTQRAKRYSPPGSWMPQVPANCIQLHWGYAFPEALPSPALATTAYELLQQERDLPLQYGGSHKGGKLEGLLREYCKGREMDNGELLVTCGSLQALEIVSRTLLESGDTIAVEAPTYMAALEIFRAHTSNILSYPIDHNGLIVETLQEDLAIRRHKGIPIPKVIYVIPTFQNPTGVTMGFRQREALLALAEEYDMLIIEDDAYGELYFTSYTHTLKSMDRTGRVIYLGSLSKTLAPGLRIGWILAPKPLIAAIKMFNTARTNPLAWAIAAQYLEGIDYNQRLEWLRTQYASRCAFLIQCLTTYMPKEVHWSHPQGGYFVWLSIDQRNTETLLVDALAAGVSFAPGKYFYAPGAEKQNQLRLSFSWLPLEDIERGIATLARVIALKET